MNIKKIFTTLLVFFFLLVSTISYAQKISLYDHTGEAVACIADDENIYLSKGDAIAYLNEQSIYGLNGKHLGWFKDGIIWDHEGYAVGFIDGAFNKVKEFEGLKAIDALKEQKNLKIQKGQRGTLSLLKSSQDPAPMEPKYQSKWARLSLENFFTTGQQFDKYASYTAQDYSVVNNVWNKQLGNGWQCINLPNKQSFSWNWNWVDNKKTVPISYPSVIFGDKPWDCQGTTARTLPCIVSSLKQLYVAHDYALNSDGGKYNVAYSLWLTDGPFSSVKAIRAEVMVWVESSGDVQPYGYPDHLIEDTENYTLYKHKRTEGTKRWDCYSFKLKQSHRIALINLGELLQNLIKNQGLSTDLYLTDVEFGTEIWNGQGKMNINFYKVSML